MYSDHAKLLRRCTATTRSGNPCHAAACWGDEAGRCSAHGGKRASIAPTCTCEAYRWPHRPGGGLCKWPDAPDAVHPTKAGTHSRLRKAALPRICAMLPAGSIKTGKPAMLNGGKRPAPVRLTRRVVTYEITPGGGVIETTQTAGATGRGSNGHD